MAREQEICGQKGSRNGNNGDGRRSVKSKPMLQLNEQIGHGQGKVQPITHLAPAHSCILQWARRRHKRDMLPPRKPQSTKTFHQPSKAVKSSKQRCNTAKWSRGADGPATGAHAQFAHLRLWIGVDPLGWRTVEPRGRYRVLQGFAFPHRPDFNVGKTTHGSHDAVLGGYFGAQPHHDLQDPPVVQPHFSSALF